MPRPELLDAVADCDALLCTMSDRIDAELLDRAPHLQVVAHYAVGYDNIDVAAASLRGVAVLNTPDVLSSATADIAWALLMASARRLMEGDALVRAGEFRGTFPTFMLGCDIEGKTLALVGAGRIAYQVAKRAALGWGMKLLYVSRTPHPEFERDFGARWMPLEDALRQADFVSLHTPLTPQTRHLISRERLALMKPTAHLINTARGPVVDEEALVEALRGGKIAGAGLDVYEREPLLADGLASLPNVVLLPHIGSATVETRGKMVDMCVDGIEKVLMGGDRPHNLVNGDQLMSRNRSR
jgi:glyoxylate reductase